MATPLVTDTLTFAEALGKHTHKHSHARTGKDQLQQQESRSSKLDERLSPSTLESRLFSPRTKLIKRTDLTLKGIFQEYQLRPTNEYILRLDSTAELNRSKIFDQWIESIPRVGHGVQEGRGLQSGGDLSEESACREQIVAIESGMSKKSSATTDVKSKEESPFAPNHHKFSFSVPFYDPSDEQEQLPSLGCSEDEIKIIAREENIVDKQNSDPNMGYPQEQEGKRVPLPSIEEMEQPLVRGLEFSKNKRLKATRRKKKIEV